jgi:alpha-tubulin suppressor-like RCC1 family protein
VEEMKNRVLVFSFVLVLSLLGTSFLTESLWAVEPQISAGYAHSIALKSDGTLWAWGYNGDGELGDGSTTDRYTPVQVSGGGSTWAAIAAGYAHTIALKSDGTLWAWGDNDYGQLGDGFNTDRHTPVQVSGGGNTWVAIAAGHFHTVALKSDGTLWAWGWAQNRVSLRWELRDSNVPIQV